MNHPNVEALYNFLHSLDYKSGWGAYGTEYCLYIGKESQRQTFLELLDRAGPDCIEPSDESREAVEVFPPEEKFSHRFKTLVEDGFVSGGGTNEIEGTCYQLKEYRAYWSLPIDQRLHGYPPVYWHYERNKVPVYVLFVKD